LKIGFLPDHNQQPSLDYLMSDRYPFAEIEPKWSFDKLMTILASR